MSFHILNSKITIGKFHFSGVHQVMVRRSLHSCADTATITIPSLCRIKRKGKDEPGLLVTGTQFTYADKVTIQLGYNGVLREEFRGFVKRVGLGMPLVVECEGYVQQLRDKVSVSGDFRKTATSAKKLLELACKGTDIKVQCPVDFPLVGIRLTEANGLQIVDYIKQASDNVLTLFFIQPDVLWCGLTYTAYADQSKANMFGMPTVKYQLGYNCIKDNGLKQRVPDERVQVIYSGKLASAVRVHTESKDKSAKRKVKALMNHVPDENTLNKFAQEKEFQHNYTGFEGYLNGFLEPFCQPGYDVVLKDGRYPKLGGTYLVESTVVTFGVRGARRAVELGPIVGFDN